jgi:hypothetical protein
LTWHSDIFTAIDALAKVFSAKLKDEYIAGLGGKALPESLD